MTLSTWTQRAVLGLAVMSVTGACSSSVTAADLEGVVASLPTDGWEAITSEVTGNGFAGCMLVDGACPQAADVYIVEDYQLFIDTVGQALLQADFDVEVADSCGRGRDGPKRSTDLHGRREELRHSRGHLCGRSRDDHGGSDTVTGSTQECSAFG